MELKRVVVTGIGAITPLGNNTNDYWNGLVNGVSGADFITLFDASKFKTRFACEVKNFDPVQFMDRKEARKIDRFTQFALVASDEAMTDAGLGWFLEAASAELSPFRPRWPNLPGAMVRPVSTPSSFPK